ncbi:hypothetical protein [Methanolobus sp.]|uniref:hypothetical protein n=1 Tax=Methanolobus sp. TaxID=1874737 RepID=UPI0025DE700D|nr:hypothetical protein [Methanolobus sp.]
MRDFSVELPTNYKAENYIKLSPAERKLFDKFIEDQIAYNQSLAKAFSSQATSFHEEKEKISYERADSTYIPFLAYCWRVAATAIGGSVVLFAAIFRLPLIEETQLRIYAIIVSFIAVIMILGLFVPLRLLPKKPLYKKEDAPETL